MQVTVVTVQLAARLDPAKPDAQLAEPVVRDQLRADASEDV